MKTKHADALTAALANAMADDPVATREIIMEALRDCPAVAAKGPAELVEEIDPPAMWHQGVYGYRGR